MHVLQHTKRAPRTARRGLTGIRDGHGCGGFERHAIDQEIEIKYYVVTSVEYEYAIVFCDAFDAMYVLYLGIVFLFCLLLFSEKSVCRPCIHANHISDNCHYVCLFPIFFVYVVLA